MSKFPLWVVAFVFGVFLSGCSSQMVKDKEDMLAASGFTLVPANTPSRQRSMAQLPPHKFVRQMRDDKVIYVYADPTICNCLYIGGQAAYGQYRANVFQQRIADEQQMTADMAQMEWGPWGSGLRY